MRANVLAMLLLMAIVGGDARAEPLIGDSPVSFSADRTVVWKDKSYVGKIYSAPGRQRHEQTINGFKVVAILRADKAIGYLMLPDMHLYTVFKFPEAVTEHGGVSRLGSPLTTGEIDGIKASEYHIDSRGSDGSDLDGVIWLTPDGVPVRIDGNYTDAGQPPHHGKLDLSNLREAPQDPALFELPPGMTEIPPESVESLFSLRMPKLKN